MEVVMSEKEAMSLGKVITNILAVIKDRPATHTTLEYNALRGGTVEMGLTVLGDLGLIKVSITTDMISINTTWYEIMIMPDTVERLEAYKELLAL